MRKVKDPIDFVLVCGGRDYNNRRALFRRMDELHEMHDFQKVIEGAAPGADTLAHEWAKARGVAFKRYPADWGNLTHPDADVRVGRYGRYDARAGFRRNQQMLDDERPDAVVWFPGGSGTRDMVNRARKAGVRCIEALPGHPKL